MTHFKKKQTTDDTHRSKKTRNKELSEKKQHQLAESMVTDILPFTHLYREDIPIRKDGVFWEILQICTKDLLNVTETDLEFDNMCFDKLYRTYSDDLKFIGINFPSDTSSQQDYIKYKLSKTSNEVFRHELQDKLSELEWINKNLTDREYYLIFFSRNLEEYRDHLAIIQRALARGNAPLMKKIPAYKKIQILYKLFNKNSFI